MKNSSDTIGDLTCDHPACSKASQPTASPRAPHTLVADIKTELKEMGWDAMDWIKLAGDRDRWWVVSKIVRNLRFL